MSILCEEEKWPRMREEVSFTLEGPRVPTELEGSSTHTTSELPMATTKQQKETMIVRNLRGEEEEREGRRSENKRGKEGGSGVEEAKRKKATVARQQLTT